MKLLDSLGQLSSITLPSVGRLVVGADLPDGLDLQILQSELRQFYGDRLKLVEDPKPVIAPSAPVSLEPEKPKTRRGRPRKEV